MKSPKALIRSSILGTVAFVLGSALLICLAPAPAGRAADAPAAGDKAPSLPLTASFSKATDPDSGPYLLKLTNTSSASINVSAKVLLSVAYHAESKARLIPAHTVEAGKDWTISGLAATDKVILTAEGFAPLEITVP